MTVACGQRIQRSRRLALLAACVALLLTLGRDRRRVDDVQPGTAWLSPVSTTTAALQATRLRRDSQHRQTRIRMLATKSRTRSMKETTMIPTGKAPFLTAAAQPFILSPNGLRTARFEYREDGMFLTVEAAPTFGPAGESTGVATARDIREEVKIIDARDLGVRGVRDLFWLDDRFFLITGYEGDSGLFFGWIADLRDAESSAKVVSMPSRTASLFVPTGMDGFPMLRKDERGDPEVLLGFKETKGDGTFMRTWSWYQTSSGDLEDATFNIDLPCDDWREVDVSPLGELQSMLHVNGSVFRKIAGNQLALGWKNVGFVRSLAEEGVGGMDQYQTTLPRQYLVGSGSDYTAFVLDTIGPDSGVPQTFPPPEDLDVKVKSDMNTASLLLDAKPESVVGMDAAEVLKQSQERQTTALIKLVADDSTPEVLFAHPFADVTPVGLWFNPKNGYPDVVMVEDLVPKTYPLSPAKTDLLVSLKTMLPKQVALNEVAVSSEDLAPLFVERHSDRWLVYYWHPSLTESVVVPAIIEEESVTWIGAEALPARGGTLSAAGAKLNPQVEARRIEVGSHDVPLYLLMPEKSQPGAMVVRVHDGPQQRDSAGADDYDAWFLSRNYAVLKVNYRGSSGFGRAWSASGAGDDGLGFMDDIVAAVRWALDDRQVLPGHSSDNQEVTPPVAIMGSYVGSAAVMKAVLEHKSLFACGVAIAPEQGAVDAAVLEQLRTSPFLLMEFERDEPSCRDALINGLAPNGCTPDSWPQRLHYVQYAGESRGGGNVKQNGMDQYRRIDSFLFRHLARAPESENEQVGLLHETFVDELPFLSAALVPKAKGKLSQTAKYLEKGFKANLGIDVTKGLASAPKQTLASKQTKKKFNTFPSYRLSVRPDGTMELMVAFTGEVEDLQVALSEVWVHLHAESGAVSFSVALPRKPTPDPIKVFKMAEAGQYVFEITGDPSIGAIENYNAWSGTSTIKHKLTKQDIADAPMYVPHSNRGDTGVSGDGKSGDSGSSSAVEVEVVA